MKGARRLLALLGAAVVFLAIATLLLVRACRRSTPIEHTAPEPDASSWSRTWGEDGSEYLHRDGRTYVRSRTDGRWVDVTELLKGGAK